MDFSEWDENEVTARVVHADLKALESRPELAEIYLVTENRLAALERRSERLLRYVERALRWSRLGRRFY